MSSVKRSERNSTETEKMHTLIFTHIIMTSNRCRASFFLSGVTTDTDVSETIMPLYRDSCDTRLV